MGKRIVNVILCILSSVVALQAQPHARAPLKVCLAIQKDDLVDLAYSGLRSAATEAFGLVWWADFQFSDSPGCASVAKRMDQIGIPAGPVKSGDMPVLRAWLQLELSVSNGHVGKANDSFTGGLQLLTDDYDGGANITKTQLDVPIQIRMTGNSALPEFYRKNTVQALVELFRRNKLEILKRFFRVRNAHTPPWLFSPIPCDGNGPSSCAGLPLIAKPYETLVGASVSLTKALKRQEATVDDVCWNANLRLRLKDPKDVPPNSGEIYLESLLGGKPIAPCSGSIKSE